MKHLTLPYPKVSIITACKNALHDLQRTVANVQLQRYLHKEHIIVDGDSRDGTQSWLKSLRHENIQWLSEPDEGISDAFNKGVHLSKGDYLYFLGAGDTFTASSVLDDIFNHLEDRLPLICGKVMRVTETGKPLWQAPNRWPKTFNKKSLLKKLTLPHQGLFMHRSFFEQYGVFDKDCKFAMDYELLLRAYKEFPQVLLIDDIVATWQAGGVGQNCILEIYDEYHKIKSQHHVAPLWQLKWIDFWNRLKFRAKSITAHRD